MKPNTIFRALPGVIVLAFSAACLANTILDTTTAITQSDPIQMGRISRNGVQQDWVGTESFGGTIYTDQVFHYHTYMIPSGNLTQGRFVQVNFDDLGLNQGNLFVSAYADSFDPTSLSTNWLADAGQSGNFVGGTSPAFFQVVVPPASNLVLVVWNAGFYNLGVGEQFRLIAEQFTDVAYTEPAVATSTTTITLRTSAAYVKPGQTCTLTFTASAAPLSTTTVNYATSGTAVVGTDYRLSGGTDQVTFSPGQTSATVTFTAINHSRSNGNLAKKQTAVSATITIKNGTGYTIGRSNSASVTVLEK